MSATDGPLALVARRVGHRVIDGAFLLRLGEVEQVIEKDAPLRRQKPAANCRVGGSLPRRCVAAAGNIEKTLHYRANGVTSFANAKIQHEPPVHLETTRRGDARKLFHQPGLADPRLAANDDSASASALTAGFDDAGKLRQLRLAADE